MEKENFWDTLSDDEKELLEVFSQLSFGGKLLLIAYAKELSEELNED